MFVDQLETAIAKARRGNLDELSRAIWSGVAGGVISDEDAQRLADLIHVKRAIERPAAPGGSSRPFSIFPARRRQISPDRRASIERRRRLASSGPLPPTVTHAFTTSEAAVLRIVADEVRDRGACTLPIDAIAARAGVSRTTVQNALRQARRLGLVEIEERRIAGAKNLPNRVTIEDSGWLAWIARSSRADRVQKSEPHGYDSSKRGKMGVSRNLSRNKKRSYEQDRDRKERALVFNH